MENKRQQYDIYNKDLYIMSNDVTDTQNVDFWFIIDINITKR